MDRLPANDVSDDVAASACANQRDPSSKLRRVIWAARPCHASADAAIFSLPINVNSSQSRALSRVPASSMRPERCAMTRAEALIISALLRIKSHHPSDEVVAQRSELRFVMIAKFSIRLESSRRL